MECHTENIRNILIYKDFFCNVFLKGVLIYALRLQMRSDFLICIALHTTSGIKQCAQSDFRSDLRITNPIRGLLITLHLYYYRATQIPQGVTDLVTNTFYYVSHMDKEGHNLSLTYLACRLERLHRTWRRIEGLLEL